MSASSSPVDRLNAVLAGRYRIERELGSGGMATVYLARDEKHDRLVALKVLKPELAAVIGAERFLHEIKTTANLQHPHILPLHDSGEVSGTVWYVMPFVEGESLRDRLARETQLPIDEALQIAREVASALDYAHRHGVIHRDIKPENILVHDGRAVVADFGIALAVSKTDGGTRITETGMSLGTPHYMSPEQALGEKNIDARTDVYALGAVLYEMLVGEPPFTGPSAQAIIAKVMSAPASPPTQARGTIPAGVEAAVLKALAKLPADRFRSAAEFNGALQGGLVAGAVTAATPVHVAAKRGRLERFAPWGIAAAAVLIAGWAAASPRPGEVPVTAAVIPLEIRTPGDAPLNEIGPPILLTRDGSSLVFVGPDPVQAGTTALWRRPLDRLEAMPIAGTHGALQPLDSPESRSPHFLVRAPDRNSNLVKMVPPEGGLAQTVMVTLPGVGQRLFGDSGVVMILPDRTLMLRRRDEAAPEGATGLRALNPIIQRSPDGVVVAMANPRAYVRDTVWLWQRDRPLEFLAVGTSPRFLDDRTLAYRAADGALMVGRLDASRTRFARPPIAMVPAVALAGNEAAIYSVADDGTLVYMSGSTVATSRLAWVRPDGGEVAIPGSEPRVYGGVALSPDGRRAITSVGALTGSGDLWIEDFAANVRNPITSNGQSIRPTWRPSGSGIAFLGSDVPNAISPANPRVVVFEKSMRSDEPAQRLPLPELTGFSIQEFQWAPDERALAVRVSPIIGSGGGTRDVLVRHAGDTVLTRFAADSADQERGPRFSPDGKWLLYVSDRAERDEVYVAPFPSGGTRVQVSSDGGREAVWSQDGSRIFYRALDGWMMAASVTRGPTLTVTRRERLFDASAYQANQFLAMYDVAPDGRFLMLRRDAAAARTDVVIVRGWVQQVLKQLDAAER